MKLISLTPGKGRDPHKAVAAEAYPSSLTFPPRRRPSTTL